MHLDKLRRFLSQHFNLEELRSLCFDLEIPPGEISGQSITGFTDSLVEYCRNRNELQNLVHVTQKHRPKLNLKEIYQAEGEQLESNNKSNEYWPYRISLMSSTTKTIERFPSQEEALDRFYKALLKYLSISRLQIGINYCGAPPLRKILIDHYIDKVREIISPLTKDEPHQRIYPELERLYYQVRWYWFAKDKDGKGFNIEPPVYDHSEVKTGDILERAKQEVFDSNVVITFTGGLGTELQIRKLLNLHYSAREQEGRIFHKRPLILLGWFDGAVKKIINNYPLEVKPFFEQYYTELADKGLPPDEEVEKWYEDDRPEYLAKCLVEVVEKLILENI